MNKEKIDKLIETLADHIIGLIEGGYVTENEITEQTKALAELISARIMAEAGTLVNLDSNGWASS